MSFAAPRKAKPCRDSGASIGPYTRTPITRRTVATDTHSAWFNPSKDTRRNMAQDSPAPQPLPPLETFAVYQRESRKTWSEIHTDHPIVYPTLGLANEVGEVAGKIKKIFRDRGGQISDADREALKQELGDVLWYFTQICTELGLSLEEVAASNLEKLFSRQARGVIRGDGDSR